MYTLYTERHQLNAMLFIDRWQTSSNKNNSFKILCANIFVWTSVSVFWKYILITKMVSTLPPLICHDIYSTVVYRSYVNYVAHMCVLSLLVNCESLKSRAITKESYNVWMNLFGVKENLTTLKWHRWCLIVWPHTTWGCNHQSTYCLLRFQQFGFSCGIKYPTLNSGLRRALKNC